MGDENTPGVVEGLRLPNSVNTLNCKLDYTLQKGIYVNLTKDSIQRSFEGMR